MTSIKDKLKKKKISYRKIASALSLSAATVNDIINYKYDGSKETTERVIKYIKLLIIDKEDMNPIVYNNPDLYIRALSYAIRNRKEFTDDEALEIIDTILKIKNFKKNSDGKN